MKKQTIIIRLLVIVGILVVVNLISDRLHFRLDFTADKRYTLSNATRGVLEDLEDVITITAYFTEDLPPQLLTVRREFEDQLIEYENRSGGNIVYEFVNPNESQEAETEAQQNGIQPVVINVRESDQVQQMRAYMGAILQMGEQQEIIPIIQPGTAMEFSLTSAIRKLSLVEKPRIAFIQGHGEPSLGAQSQLAQQLSVLYNPETYQITDTAVIPDYYEALVIVNPTDTFPVSHLAQLDRYLQNNGKLYLAFNTVKGDLNSGSLRAAPGIGIQDWLTDKGINVSNQFIVDANAAPIMVQQRQGPFVMNTQIQFPYFPRIVNFSDQPIVEGLEAMVLPFASPITINTDTTIRTTPLAFSSENTGLITPPSYVDINKQWTESDFTSDPQTVAVAIEGPVAGSGYSRMVVISNGVLAVNGEGQQAQQVSEDNLNFVTNSIDWLSDDTGLIDLRTKGVTSRPIAQLDEGEKNVIKYANVAAPILIILIYAFIRRQRYQRKKQNWLQGNY